ncbi:hypothetical protein RR48_14600 [Papilio machaon]|uniref:Uncharacterized protein n=1 Tax=Papilio machaon TaxID=76193 RepID=A0A194QKS0_PAPMA|nr:hypothetical protein RR48_14600 [Papilio machaon]
MKDSAPRCEDVADKLVRLFGWRQTYPVEKLQRNLLPKNSEGIWWVFEPWHCGRTKPFPVYSDARQFMPARPTDNN